MLETAIRPASEETLADEALALLGFEMSRTFEGSDFEELALEGAQLLHELRRLVEAR